MAWELEGKENGLKEEIIQLAVRAYEKGKEKKRKQIEGRCYLDLWTLVLQQVLSV